MGLCSSQTIKTGTARCADGVGAVLFVEEGVVILGGIDGRIEIDEVNGFVLEVTTEESRLSP
jgi:hypothetical protein